MELPVLSTIETFTAIAQSDEDLVEAYISLDGTIAFDYPTGWIADEIIAPGIIRIANSQESYDLGCGTFPSGSLNIGIISPTTADIMMPQLMELDSLEAAYQLLVSIADLQPGEPEYTTLAGKPALIFDMPYTDCDGVRVLIDYDGRYIMAVMDMPTGEIVEQKARGLRILDTLRYSPTGNVESIAVLTADRAAQRLLIFGEINEGPNSTGNHDFSPGQSNFSLAFYTQLRDILVDAGFEPVFIRASASEYYPDFFEPLDEYLDIPEFWVRVTLVKPTSYGTADWVAITPLGGYQFPALPMGVPNRMAMSRISTERAASQKEVARLGAGILLYANNYCAAALPYLTEASTNEALMDDGLLIYGSTLFFRAACEYDQGLIDEAVMSYQALLEHTYDFDGDPRLITENAAINLAWIYAQQDQRAEALTLLDAYISVVYESYDDISIERFLKRADIYLTLDAGEAAIREIDQLITIAAEQNTLAIEGGGVEVFPPAMMSGFYLERALCYLRLDQFEQAMADFDRALAIDVQQPLVYYWRGVWYYIREDFEHAQADFDHFLAIVPTEFIYYEDDLTPYIEQATEYLELIAEETSTETLK